MATIIDPRTGNPGKTHVLTNKSSSTLTISVSGGGLIDDVSSVELEPENSVTIVIDDGQGVSADQQWRVIGISATRIIP